MIYFTSDLHLGHVSILKHRSGFDDIETMNRVIMDGINSVVAPGDTLYLLGDITHRVSMEEANRLISNINGKKVLLTGNHDGKYDPSLFEDIEDYIELKHNGRRYVLMHYPLVCWNHMKEGSIQLHGHIHSRADYNQYNHDQGRLQYDVGVDANGFLPVSVSQIEKWASSCKWEEYAGIEHHRANKIIL